MCSRNLVVPGFAAENQPQSRVHKRFREYISMKRIFAIEAGDFLDLLKISFGYQSASITADYFFFIITHLPKKRKTVCMTHHTDNLLFGYCSRCAQAVTLFILIKLYNSDTAGFDSCSARKSLVIVQKPFRSLHHMDSNLISFERKLHSQSTQIGVRNADPNIQFSFFRPGAFRHTFVMPISNGSNLFVKIKFRKFSLTIFS